MISFAVIILVLQMNKQSLGDLVICSGCTATKDQDCSLHMHDSGKGGIISPFGR